MKNIILLACITFSSCAYRIKKENISHSISLGELRTIIVGNSEMKVELEVGEEEKKCDSIERHEYFLELACSVANKASSVKTERERSEILRIEVKTDFEGGFEKLWLISNMVTLTIIPYWNTTYYEASTIDRTGKSRTSKQVSLTEYSFLPLIFVLPFIDDRGQKEKEVHNLLLGI